MRRIYEVLKTNALEGSIEVLVRLSDLDQALAIYRHEKGDEENGFEIREVTLYETAEERLTGVKIPQVYVNVEEAEKRVEVFTGIKNKIEEALLTEEDCRVLSTEVLNELEKLDPTEVPPLLNYIENHLKYSLAGVLGMCEVVLNQQKRLVREGLVIDPFEEVVEEEESSKDPLREEGGE